MDVVLLPYVHTLSVSLWRKASTFFYFLHTQKPTLGLEITCNFADMYSVEVWWRAWWNNYIQHTKHRGLHRRCCCCCFTNVLLMCIVSGSTSPVHSLSACIGVDWFRHKLITITHWSNWPGPDHRVANNWLVWGSILWSEKVGAENTDAEEGGGMFCNVADQSGWTVQFRSMC